MEEVYENKYSCSFCGFRAIASDLMKYHLFKEHMSNEDFWGRKNNGKNDDDSKMNKQEWMRVDEVLTCLKKENRELKRTNKDLTNKLNYTMAENAKLRSIIVQKEMAFFDYQNANNNDK